jgi:hypothetical protein
MSGPRFVVCVNTDMPFAECQKIYLFNLYLLLAIPMLPYFLVSNILHERCGLVCLNLVQVFIYATGLWVNW